MTTEAVTAKEPMLCDVCGRNMRTKSGAAIIGVCVSHAESVAPHPEASTDGEPQMHSSLGLFTPDMGDFYEVYPELAGYQAQVCTACWYRSMGLNVPTARS